MVSDTIFCCYCSEAGEATPATSWCSVCDDALRAGCVQMHKRNPPCHRHGVVGMSGETTVKVNVKVMYKVHKDENIRYICKDCRKTACQICCSIQHRKCDKVVEIEFPAMKAELRLKKEDMLKKHFTMKTTVGAQKRISQ